MHIIRQQQELPKDFAPRLAAGSAVTIGNFDGLHVGHQRLITRTVHKAHEASLVSVVMTFCPHPLKVLAGDKAPPLLTVREQKLDLLERMGLDLVFLCEFTRAFAAMTPEQFVKTQLVGFLHTKELVIGYDYAFGKGRAGDYEVLSALGREHGFGVEQLDPVIVDGAVVSSTRIRDLIRAGDVWTARRLLGRFFTVRGRVVHGHKRGSALLGFPTANVDFLNEVCPAVGVYACWVLLPTMEGMQGDEAPRMAVANVGYNPTFGNEALSVEAHILDFDADLYGEEVKVLFVQRIRGEKKFSGVEELKARIGEDVRLARRILSTPEARV